MVHLDKTFGRTGNRMFQMAYIYAQMKRGVIKDIFVQDYSLFNEYKDEIQKLFGEGIGYLPYTSLHVRVGGNPVNPTEPRYADNPFYTSLVKSGYYIKALEKFPHEKFLVFSDDMEFAKNYLTGDKFLFDDSKDDIESFNKAASCQNHIISNSSFSWMWAYLSPSINKVIVCPKEEEWFADGQSRMKIPPEWIQIKL